MIGGDLPVTTPMVILYNHEKVHEKADGFVGLIDQLCLYSCECPILTDMAHAGIVATSGQCLVWDRTWMANLGAGAYFRCIRIQNQKLRRILEVLKLLKENG